MPLRGRKQISHSLCGGSSGCEDFAGPRQPSVGIEIAAENNHQIDVLADVALGCNLICRCVFDAIADYLAQPYLTRRPALRRKEFRQMGKHPSSEFLYFPLRKNVDLFLPNRQHHPSLRRSYSQANDLRKLCGTVLFRTGFRVAIDWGPNYTVGTDAKFVLHCGNAFVRELGSADTAAPVGAVQLLVAGLRRADACDRSSPSPGQHGKSDPYTVDFSGFVHQVELEAIGRTAGHLIGD